MLLSLLFALIAVMLLFGQACIVYVYSALPEIKLSPPNLMSIYSYKSIGLQAGQHLFITTTVSRGFQYEGPFAFVVFIEVRDSDGVTQYLAFQSGQLTEEIDYQPQIGTPWIPPTAGIFSLRIFAVSDLENPQVLTQVYESTVEIDEPIICGGTAECFRDHVMKIVDGDTLDVGDTRIRLALVNTPEIDEPGYDASKAFASSLCPVGSEAIVDEDDGQTEGSYGRMIAKVTCGEVLNEEPLKAGLAEIVPQFCNVSEFRNEDWAKPGCQW